MKMVIKIIIRLIFLHVEMMAAEDVPLKGIHLSPCHGMVLRGRNAERNADIEKRHEA